MLPTDPVAQRKFLQHIRGWYMYRKRRIIMPDSMRHPNHWPPLTWVPKAFLAAITHDGIVPHGDLGNPSARIFMAATISHTDFDRYVRYYAGKEYQLWETLSGVRGSDPIYLLAEEDDANVYCMAQPLEVLVIFGKLLRSDSVYKKCLRAFGKLI